jgi:hypothetical protein
MNTHSNANPNTTTSPNAANASSTEPWMRNPTAKPMAVVMVTLHTSTGVSARARPARTALRGMGSEGSRSTNPLRQVLGNAGGRAPAGEQDDGGDDPWNQKVHIAEAAGADRRRPGGRSSSRNWAGEMLRVMKRYRDIARLSLGRIPMGPTLALTKEWVFELLRPVGIPDRIIGYLGDLMGLYIGAYAFEESLGLASPTGEVLPPHEIIALFRDYILSLPPDRFPHTLSAVDALFSGGPEERFEFGLDIVVRGLETYARPAGTHEGEPA